MKFIKIFFLWCVIFANNFMQGSYRVEFFQDENMPDVEKNTTVAIEEMNIRHDHTAYEILTYASGKTIRREVAIVTDEIIENGTMRRISYDNGWVRASRNSEIRENEIVAPVVNNNCCSIS